MISIDIDDEKLKHELQRVLNKIYQTESFNISDLNLTSNGFSTRNDLTFNLKIDARFSDYLDFLNLSNMIIKHSTIKQLKKEQKKQGYKDLMTLIADILEKHYES